MTACAYRLNFINCDINKYDQSDCDIDITFSMSEYARPNIREVFNSMQEQLKSSGGKVFMSALNTWQFVFNNAKSVSGFEILGLLENSLNQTSNDKYFFDEKVKERLTRPELRAVVDSAN